MRGVASQSGRRKIQNSAEFAKKKTVEDTLREAMEYVDKTLEYHREQVKRLEDEKKKLLKKVEELRAGNYFCPDEALDYLFI